MEGSNDNEIEYNEEEEVEEDEYLQELQEYQKQKNKKYESINYICDIYKRESNVKQKAKKTKTQTTGTAKGYR